MCGIAGIVSQNAIVNSDLFDALTMLQHRGQDAAGIITNEGHRLHLRKEKGHVREVFNSDDQMAKLRGSMGVANGRNQHAGSQTPADAQTYNTKTAYGLALTKNGTITTTDKHTKKELLK